MKEAGILFPWSGELESWLSAYFMDGSISRRRYGARLPSNWSVPDGIEVTGYERHETVTASK